MAELRVAANWQVSGTGIWGITPLNARVRIAEVTLVAPSNGVNWVDHARLIAAAPDMLAALIACRQAREFAAAVSEGTPDGETPAKHLMDNADLLFAKAHQLEAAAIAKAEG